MMQIRMWTESTCNLDSQEKVILLFAYDTLLFSTNNERKIDKLINLISLFEDASGLNINR